jgi:hypothetical protein
LRSREAKEKADPLRQAQGGLRVAEDGISGRVVTRAKIDMLRSMAAARTISLDFSICRIPVAATGRCVLGAAFASERWPS